MKQKELPIPITMLIGITLLFACTKKNDIATSSNPNVFVGGSSTTGSGSIGYWENGKFNGLSSNISESVNGIFVQGKDIYIIGSDNGRVKYWKNGVVSNLSDGLSYAYATSINVSGSDVYVTGSDYSIAKYWKNGIAVDLPNSGTNGMATGIAVSGDDVYVSGYENGDSTVNYTTFAVYWKNGVEYKLSDTHYYADANAISFSGGDLYVAGSQNNIPAYWKNGQIVNLPLGYGGDLTAIAVSGSNIYLAGYESGTGSHAIFWKNGSAMTLTSGSNEYSRATGIALDGTDVYVCGFEDVNINGPGSSWVAKYWKNGNEVVLGNGIASSIFVSSP